MIIERVELRNTRDGHPKAYILALEKDGKNFIVRARWGRIDITENGRGREQVKGKFSNENPARELMGNLISRKKLRGYVEHSVQTFGREQHIPQSRKIQSSLSPRPNPINGIWSTEDISNAPQSFAEALRAELETDRRGTS